MGTGSGLQHGTCQATTFPRLISLGSILLDAIRVLRPGESSRFLPGHSISNLVCQKTEAGGGDRNLQPVK